MALDRGPGVGEELVAGNSAPSWVAEAGGVSIDFLEGLISFQSCRTGS